MKKLTLFLIIAIGFNFAMGQKRKKKDETPVVKVNHDSLLTDLISQTGDLDMMLYHLYNKAAKDSTDNSSLEQIAYIYLLQGKYVYCINTCNLLLAKNPAHIKGLEILASAYQGVNQRESAIITYQKLLGYKQHPNTYYQLASLYFETGNDQGCQDYLNKVMRDSTSGNYNVVINFQDNQKQTQRQEVNLLAASYNIVGFLYLKNKQIAEAKKFFNAAIQISPNFVLPKGNLQLIQQIENEANKEVQE